MERVDPQGRLTPSRDTKNTESVRSGSRAFLKQGDWISPLYSRPETRIIPSDQKESCR